MNRIKTEIFFQKIQNDKWFDVFINFIERIHFDNVHTFFSGPHSSIHQLELQQGKDVLCLVWQPYIIISLNFNKEIINSSIHHHFTICVFFQIWLYFTHHITCTHTTHNSLFCQKFFLHYLGLSETFFMALFYFLSISVK